MRALTAKMKYGGASRTSTARHAGTNTGVQIHGASSFLEAGFLCRRVATRPKLYSNRKMRRPVGYPEHPASIGEHLLRKRRISGLRQREVAAKLRVGLGTYFTWELGTRSPSIRHWPALFAYLGYDPVPTLTGEAGQIEAVRRQLGWSLRQVADFIGVDQGTLARWKNERTTPVYSGDRLDAFLALLWHFVFSGFFHQHLTVVASLRRRPCEEDEDGLPDGWHAGLGRRSWSAFFFVQQL